MGGRFRSERQLIARLLANADASLAALGNEALEALVLTLASNENVVKTAAAGLEGFFNCVQAVENFHEDSLRGVAGLAALVALTQLEVLKCANARG
jgi:uncharacterized membrane protein YhfC